jgi:hypothetical protein
MAHCVEMITVLKTIFAPYRSPTTSRWIYNIYTLLLLLGLVLDIFQAGGFPFATHLHKLFPVIAHYQDLRLLLYRAKREIPEDSISYLADPSSHLESVHSWPLICGHHGICRLSETLYHPHHPAFIPVSSSCIICLELHNTDTSSGFGCISSLAASSWSRALMTRNSIQTEALPVRNQYYTGWLRTGWLRQLRKIR